MVACRELADEGVAAVRPFKGKRLMGALCGKTVTTNTADRKKMQELCEQEELEVWLPNGEDIYARDGCIASVSAPTCSALMQPATRLAGSLHCLLRQHRLSRTGLGSQFLGQRPIRLPCSRPFVQGFVGFR